MEYKNRYGLTYHFDHNDDGNIDWKGNFRYTRFGFDEIDDKEIINFIDPSGGPFIRVGMDMSEFGFEGTVTGFVNHKDHYEIVINKK